MPHRFLVALLVLAVVLAGCVRVSLPEMPFQPTPPPTVTPAVLRTDPAPLGDADTLLQGLDAREQRLILIYGQTSPAVVNITTQVLVNSFFFGAYPEEGSGSGFVWDDAGHIVTNYHVVENADSLSVNFGNDTSLPAEIVGIDPPNDLAVIKVEQLPEAIEPLALGDSDTLQVGQLAIAIGNPFGQFQRTLTTGVISALNRTIQTDNKVLRGAIQTDASINRGNSGGPLLDSRGRLIGVNTAIFSPTGTSAGVGLAIPVNKVKQVVPILIERGRYPHPWLGAVGYDITPRLARQLGLPVQSGLLVAQLYNGSPAQQAGLQGADQQVVVGNRYVLTGGDIITAIDGQPLATWDDLDRYLEEKTAVGQVVTLDISRGDQAGQLQLELAEAPVQGL